MPQATMRRQYPAVTSRGPTSTTRPCSERSASGRRANATRSVKHAPAPGSLLDRQGAADHAGELARDRQAEPGAAIAPGDRFVDLREALEDALLGVRRNADAGVLDLDPQRGSRGRDGLARAGGS